MTTKSRKGQTNSPLLLSVEGFDHAGRKIKLSISTDSAKHLAELIREIDNEITILPDTATTKPKQQNPELCPRCNSQIYNNTKTRVPGSSVPVLKCSKCAWRFWEFPRNDREISDNDAWIELHGDPTK